MEGFRAISLLELSLFRPCDEGVATASLTGQGTVSALGALRERRVLLLTLNSGKDASVILWNHWWVDLCVEGLTAHCPKVDEGVFKIDK